MKTYLAKGLGGLAGLGMLLVGAGCGSSSSPASGGITPATSLLCQAADSGAGTPISFRYFVTAFSDGSKFVEAEVSINGGAQVSSSKFYKSTQFGATDSDITVTDPISGNTSGFWEFKTLAGASSVTYHQAGGANDGYSVTFAGNSCSQN